MKSERRVLEVSALARVEGQGAMHVEVRDGRVESVRLEIYEPPRFFEALLRGRDYREAPDITSRICGICPIAYQMSAVHALEDALGVKVTGALRELRRLAYCAEWIASHTLHVVMLHAPDFLGCADVIGLARTHRAQVERALGLKKTGNALMALLGGREIHPINVRVGGFYRVPTRAELRTMREPLLQARDAAEALVAWVGGFEFPDFERDYDFVCLRHASEYPFNEGRLVSSRGLDVDVHAFEETFVESQVPHSTALQSSTRDGRPYMTGPMARYSLNHDRLPERVRQAARAAGLGPTCRNPFRSIVVRAVEVLFACEEALRIIDAYEAPTSPAVPVEPRAGEGCAVTEAPRGSLFHRYRVDAQGLIAEANIVPPTSQNQRSVEADMKDVVQAALALDDDALTRRCELAIRNYDPCISCATHFLRLHVRRR